MTEELFEAAPCGYIEVDGDGIIARANAKFLALIGRTSEDVVGRMSFAGMLAVGDRIYHETHFRPMLQMHGEVHEIAFELVRPDDARVPVLVSANLRGEGADAKARIIVFEARDRRSYEKELLAAKRAAEDAEAHARSLTQTLQRTFIPPTPPRIPGLEVSGVYRPAGDGTEVGGDFYDVFQIRPGEWLVVLGDVSGKGVEAAALTTFIRHSVREFVVEARDPSDVLRELNAALLEDGSDRFCTVVVMWLLAEDDHWLVSMSSGGHPLPFLRTGTGEVESVGFPGSLLGVLAVPSLEDARFEIRDGDSLVLFTDGVTEARQDDSLFGEDRVRHVISGSGSSAESISAALLAEVMAFQGPDAKDDIAILAVSVDGDPGARSRAAGAGATETDRLTPEQKLRSIRELASSVDLAD